MGAVVAHNLLTAGFEGPIMPVNPHESAIDGVLAYHDVASLPECPELAVIATPPGAIPETLMALGARGCRAAVVVTAGFEAEDQASADARAAILAAAQQSHVRLIGPNCLGMMVPGAGVNASFGHVAPLKGRIACVMQSGALAAAVLDWATAQGIGFSKLVSLGDALDVDFGDMLNYLAADPETDFYSALYRRADPCPEIHGRRPRRRQAEACRRDQGRAQRCCGQGRQIPHRRIGRL